MDQKCLIRVFLTKNALFGYFWARIQKNYCHIWNSTPKIFKNESVTYTVNFGIESALSKGAGSAFSEGLGPGPSPLYKVFLLLTMLRRHKFWK